MIVLLGALSLSACSGDPPPPPSPPVTDPPPATADADPCTLPGTPAPTLEETAWRLFVAATCPTSDPGHPLTFQTWTEQSCLRTPSTPGCGGDGSPRKRTLHGSQLLAARTARGPLAAAPPVASECQPMVTLAQAPYDLKPFAPTNLSASPTFCEEVFANAPETAYIEAPAPGHTLLTLDGQAAYVATGQTIDFPTGALEIKADWLPASALATPFDCQNPPAGLYTESIAGVCYALVGVHLSSKLYPKWLWATFEPQSTVTNPNRCKPDLYSACTDPWGSDPAISTGSDTRQTPALAALMQAAALPPTLANYRLVGVQTDYVDTSTTLLGNSFVEFNAQVLPKQASCITCHEYAQFDASTTPPQENPTGGGPYPAGAPSVGTPPPPQPGWQRQDFSWMLGFLARP